MSKQRYLPEGEQNKYKIILVGDSGVGKTALFWRFIEGQFSELKFTQVTTVDFSIKNVSVMNQKVKLYIWDTAGQERYRSIVSTYFKGCHAVILMFDLSNQQSFENIKTQWIPLINSKVPTASKIIVGNKKDLHQEIDQQEVLKWAKENNFKAIFCSAKDNLNVNQPFLEAGKLVMRREEINKTESFALKSKKDPKKKSCC